MAERLRQGIQQCAKRDFVQLCKLPTHTCADGMELIVCITTTERPWARTVIADCSYSLVQFNIVIAVLSMFILLAKSTMYVLHVWIPLLSVPVHILEVALYAVSVSNQSTPDMSDPDHPSPGLPWYLSKGCKYAESGNYGFCMQARGAFGVTCVMV